MEEGDEIHKTEKEEIKMKRKKSVHVMPQGINKLLTGKATQ